MIEGLGFMGLKGLRLFKGLEIQVLVSGGLEALSLRVWSQCLGFEGYKVSEFRSSFRI